MNVVLSAENQTDTVFGSLILKLMVMSLLIEMKYEGRGGGEEIREI